MSEQFISKRRARMFAYMNKNPYCVYGDYRDSISDEMAQMLIAGKFEAFDESIFEWEMHNSHYVDWASWESEFADEFGYESFDDMPERIQELARENRVIDQSHYIETCLRGYSGNIVATVKKRNGEYVEFPCRYEYDRETNKRLARYLREHCGITGDSEAGYSGTYLRVLGKLDFLEIYKNQKIPTHIKISSGDFTIGHNAFNGSGTMANDQYSGKTRVMAADFKTDNSDRYGIDSTYGLTGRCWQNEITLA